MAELTQGTYVEFRDGLKGTTMILREKKKTLFKAEPFDLSYSKSIGILRCRPHGF